MRATSDPASFIPATKYPVLHRAALDACDGRDGATDGLISDPLRCQFDPGVTTCTSADGPDCLTAAQVTAARKIYAPLKDDAGREIFPGLEPGSELRWAGTSGGPRPLAVADDLFKFVVFQDPAWDVRTLDLAKHLELARKIDNGTLSPTSANIAPFVARGGKLLMYHGWGDQNISPRSSVNYYERLVETLGQRQTDSSVRLYMVPGMGHCGGGEGPSSFDMLRALEDWREHGKTPPRSSPRSPAARKPAARAHSVRTRRCLSTREPATSIAQRASSAGLPGSRARADGNQLGTHTGWRHCYPATGRIPLVHRPFVLVFAATIALVVTSSSAFAQNSDITVFFGSAYPIFDERLRIHPGVPAIPGVDVSVDGRSEVRADGGLSSAPLMSTILGSSASKGDSTPPTSDSI